VINKAACAPREIPAVGCRQFSAAPGFFQRLASVHGFHAFDVHVDESESRRQVLVEEEPFHVMGTNE
jgi:hypothetical protein